MNGLHRFWEVVIAIAAVTAASSSSYAQESTTAQNSSTAKVTDAESKPPRKRPDIYLGPEAGVYFPVSAKTRRRFGTGWADYGVTPGSIYTAKDGGSILPDLHILSRSSGADRVFFLLAGAEYRKALIPIPRANPAENGKRATQMVPAWVPYGGASFDLLIGDALTYEDNVHSGIRQGFGASVFCGVTYKNRAYIETRFIGTSTVKSFDLSGFSLNIGMRFRL